MAKRLQLTKNVTPIGFGKEVTAEYFSVQDFIEKQKDFIIYKRSQNLSTRTLYDYDRAFLYLNSYIKHDIIISFVVVIKYTARRIKNGFR